ncbi:zinc finger protein 654-like isoform X1 [Paramormyrops kingsleyae]|uniref:zinc finger protein 654-like isoform X1 n=1 Tax=Paramormyrops kingsleyae TaxID=1676925 RepID=UPI003B96F35D
MAEEESDLESERLKEELESLLDATRNDEPWLKSKNYCSRFCELVEEHAGRWQVPLPQLQVLRTALCYFTHGTVSFPNDCEHVQYTLGSLALSFFELLLFFGKDEFLEDPLKDILDSFQDCFANLVRYNNVYLWVVNQIIRNGGPWANSTLQAILRESVQLQDEARKYLDSEEPVFFDLRVRYLLACDRIQEAVALAKSCTQHPEMGKHLYFHQVHLTCLWKTSLLDHFQKEMAVIDGRDAVEILCNTEKEEKDDLLLAFSKAFLTQQLQNGDMYYMWDLIFIWSKLHLRANPSKENFLEECYQLMQRVTNVKSIFPFMKVIRDEMGNEGLQFCVDLCARALQMDLHHDPVTKSLIYKTIAYLLPSDLEVCRACALLVFFLERTVESYKTVYILYTHPDQEYHVDSSLIKNQIRFEILQILKKGLFFDPEFWNLITLRTNCLKLMSEKVMKAALNEIIDDKWMPHYCVKEPYKLHSDASDCNTNEEVKLHRNKPEVKLVPVPAEETVPPPAKKRGRKPGSRVQNLVGECQLRRSFRRLDMSQENSNMHGSREQRHLARQVEKKTLKCRGRKPRWLLQDMARQAENSISRRSYFGKKMQHFPTEKLSECATGKTSIDMETQEVFLEKKGDEVSSHVEVQGEMNTVLTQSQDQAMSMSPAPLLEDAQAIPVHGTLLEFSLPDNEFMESFSVDHDVELPEQGHHQQDSTQENIFGIPKVPMEQLLAKPCMTETDAPLEGLSKAESPPLSTELNSELCEELAIELHIATIQELHNYSKILEETSEVGLQSLPGAASPMQKEDLYKSGQDYTIGHSCQRLVETEVSSPVQTSIVNPVFAAKVSIVGSEIRHDVIHIDTTCEIPLEGNVSDINRNIIPNGGTGDPQIMGNATDYRAIPYESQTKIAASTDGSSDFHSVPSAADAEPHKPLAALSASSSSPTKMGNLILKHRCKECNKEFRGGNIMRHAVAHLQRDKLKCMFCTEVFRSRIKAKSHVTEHIEKMKNAPNCNPDIDIGTTTASYEDIVLPYKTFNNEAVDMNHTQQSNISRGKVKANGFVETGSQQSEKGEYCCPADGCDKTFARAEWPLIRHAMKFHADDVKVQEYTFSLKKGNCHFCKRKFLSLPHYQDHIRGHNHPLKHPCLHYDCKERFKTLTELKSHMKSHQPLQAQCSFAGCLRRFSLLRLLFEHELKHYLPTKAKDETQDTVWVVRGKREEFQDTTNSGLVCQEPTDCKNDRFATSSKYITNSMAISNEKQELQAQNVEGMPVLAEGVSSTEDKDADIQLVNGHGKNGGRLDVSAQTECKTESPQESEQENRLGNKSVDDKTQTESAVGQQEPCLPGQKAAKPGEQSGYGGTSNRPFVRLAPSAYLDEKYISMPKRRKSSAVPSPSSVQQSSPSDKTPRQRCAKCFLIFSSAEELQSHHSSNQCTSLFGFDSDEEGMW